MRLKLEATVRQGKAKSGSFRVSAAIAFTHSAPSEKTYDKNRVKRISHVDKVFGAVPRVRGVGVSSRRLLACPPQNG